MDAVVCSLVYLFRGDEIYLPVSRSGPTKGKRSSGGGKQELGETIYESGIREPHEEFNGLVIVSMVKRGVMLFHWNRKIEVPGLNRPGKFDVEVHIYTSEDWHGQLMATEAFGEPSWYPKTQIPYHEMMPCEELWFSQMLLGKQFTGEMRYQKVDGQVYCQNAFLHKRPRLALLQKP